jgi:hypothetical protein
MESQNEPQADWQNEPKKSDNKNVVALVVLVMFCVSLSLPAIIFSDNDYHRGFSVLIYGILGVLAGDFAWFANPVFVGAYIAFCARAFAVSGFFSLICVGLAATSYTAKSALISFSSPATIKSLASGFHLWMASFVVLLVASALMWFVANRQRA